MQSPPPSSQMSAGQTPPQLPNSPPQTRNGKERRLPSITPRKFRRFFTPRTRASAGSTVGRHPLVDITAPANNANRTRSHLLTPFEDLPIPEDDSEALPKPPKRQKLFHSPAATPERVSTKHLGCDAADDFPLHSSQDDDIPSSPCRRGTAVDRLCREIRPRLRFDERGQAGQFLQRSFGTSRQGRQHMSFPAPDWQHLTASFYSTPQDVHFCTGVESRERCIPFCTVSCNTNTLVAVGDEEGRVRLLESAEGGQPTFKDMVVNFRPHRNAIIDMAFTDDDTLLATASGDQSARVVDMSTQTTLSALSSMHTASLKQVRFQPGQANHSVLATCSRDGSIQIWDLRCKGQDGPVQAFEDEVEDGPRRRAFYAATVDSIYDAHSPLTRSTRSQSNNAEDAPMRGEAPGRNSDVSVTALSFLPAGQEHLLLSASASSTSVRLWDIRSLRTTRNRSARPLSYTKLPESHHRWRHFGISSLNLNTDGSRLYAVCKDNTVYAYSTAHLLLGHAPELSEGARARRAAADVQEGLGPLYGFRHPQLHVSSFYVKSAVRKARDGHAELLAVGSSDGCAVLFPTDERFLGLSTAPASPVDGVRTSGTRPTLRRSGSSTGLTRLVDDLPMSTRGTALIRGHEKEVGALTWTSRGDLVTVGDDFLVRCWHEGDTARSLRVGGETGGRRWGCGWAAASSRYDRDDDDL